MLGFLKRLLGNAPSAPPAQIGTSKRSLPSPLPVTVELTVTSSSRPRDVFNVGALTETQRGWVLNPKSTFPLTVYGVTREQASELKKLLDQPSMNYYEGRRQLGPMIARWNVCCRELDDYVAEFKPRYLAKIEDQKNSSPAWPSASELDKEDLLVGFRKEAIEALDVQPFVDLETLFEEEPEDATIDDTLLDRYGYEPLQVYFRHSRDIRKVHLVKADGYDRAAFETLVAHHLATQGSDIPTQDVLTKLTLKELNALATDAPKPFARKAKAIEHLLTSPDLVNRLRQVVAYRELFQLKPLPPEFDQINFAKVGSSWRYASEVGSLLAHTYSFGATAARDFAQGAPYAKGWEIVATDTSCPACKRAAGRKYPRTKPPKVPIHLGCRCCVVQRFE